MRLAQFFIIATSALLATACTTQTPQSATAETVAIEVAPARTYITLGDPANLKADSNTVFITGTNRGIGLEYVRQLKDRGLNIIATARKPNDATDLIALAADYPQLVIEELDVTDYERVANLGEKYADQPFDILLSNAGLVPRYKTAFRRVDGMDFDMARSSWEVNAIAPLKLAQIFLPNVAASEQKKIVIISSKAGSFELSPKMPMMYSYRGSKAALNMYMYTLSFETAKKGVIVTMLSPGQVNTTPGYNMPIAIEVDESVSKMLTVIDGLTAENNGQFLDYEDGRVLGW
jgi:NAD(P)-dependent dehydrogenase (short-subunit alcohol dehydrogenase family)